MGKPQLHIALVLPTKDHPDDLARLLRSLASQTILPHQIVIVDGSATPVHSVLKDFSSLPVTYERVFPPGLAKQQNAGIRRIDNTIDLVGFVDDDMVFERDALEAMLTFWNNAASDVGGGSI